MNKIVISLSYGKDDTEKATLAFNIGSVGIVSNQDITIFLSAEAVCLAENGYADSIHVEGFKPLKELMDSFASNGGQVWVCSPCYLKRHLSETNMIKNATLVGGIKLVEALSQGATCVSY